MEGDEEETNENMARKWELDDGGGFYVTTVQYIGEERGKGRLEIHSNPNDFSPLSGVAGKGNEGGKKGKGRGNEKKRME